MPSCESGGRRSGVERWRQAGESAAAASGRARGTPAKPRVTLPASDGVVAARATFSTHTHRSEWAAAVKPPPSAVAKLILRSPSSSKLHQVTSYLDSRVST
uniref:Uncharacterized protein n=1 Tax=Oryza nivara TaxID=4536 RepID=A0A0E0FPZ3_ORYNI